MVNISKADRIVRRITRLERRALYDGMTAAVERAINRLWRAHHRVYCGEIV